MTPMPISVQSQKSVPLGTPLSPRMIQLTAEVLALKLRSSISHFVIG